MTNFEIRAMTAADVDAAVALARAQGWRDRRRFYEFVLRTSTCRPLVGVFEGRVVATGLGTVSLPVGWIGAIAVDEGHRRRGHGRAMTERICEELRAAGCVTLSLEATDAGRPLYVRMGFRVVTSYHQLQAEHLPEPPIPPDGARVRRIVAADLPAIFQLDRRATGEDRSVSLRVLAEAGGWMLEDDARCEDDGRSVETQRLSTLADAPCAETGLSPAAKPSSAAAELQRAAEPRPLAAPPLRGFLLPAERMYGAIVAPRFEDGLYLLDLHRHVVREGGWVRAGIPHQHDRGWAELLARGWQETWRAPRLLLGPDVAWRPEWIWGQINSAMG